MTASYFEKLGQEAAANLARASGRFGGDPAMRQRLRSIADRVFEQHFDSPGMARDALPSNMEGNSMAYRPVSMSPRGGYMSGGHDQDDPANGGPLSAESVLAALQQALGQMDDDEKANLLSGLQMILEGDDSGGQTNSGAMDSRRRAWGRLAQDSAFAYRRRCVFLERFPEMRNVDVGNIAAWTRRDV
jgi:hypothetical protein